jgi:hypothetical protein
MSTDAATQLACNCPCGRSLRWETREGFGQRRSVALCSNPDCGLITSASPDGVQPDHGLVAYLLGPVTARRYLKPWVRLYFKATRWGFQWRAHHEVCSTCGSELTTQLGLPPLAERQNDPFLVTLCLSCGTTNVAWWRSGERIVLVIASSDWDEPTTAVTVLKRTLEQRADGPSEGYEWAFR